MKKPKSLKDGDYVLSEGAAWFTIENISIRLHKTDEGVICDMYPLGKEAADALVSTYAYFHEANNNEEQEGVPPV